MTKRNPRVAAKKAASSAITAANAATRVEQIEIPAFNFAKWTRPMNQQLAALYNDYRRAVVAATVYDQREKTSRIAGLSTDGDEANTLLTEANAYRDKCTASLKASYQLEVDMWVLIGHTLSSVPDSWLLEDVVIPDVLDFTDASTYDRFIRMDKVAHLVRLFTEARDQKN